jgi:hypothetical protein
MQYFASIRVDVNVSQPGFIQVGYHYRGPVLSVIIDIIGGGFSVISKRYTL